MTSLNTEKRVENTMGSGRILTNFEVRKNAIKIADSTVTVSVTFVLYTFVFFISFYRLDPVRCLNPRK